MSSYIQAKQDEEGFTLIELLVVVIIIGILAAIAIPVFLNQRQGAWDRAAQTSLRNAAVAQESFFTEEGEYTADVDDLRELGFPAEGDVVLDIVTPETVGPTFCVTALHTSSDEPFEIRNGGAQAEEGDCT